MKNRKPSTVVWPDDYLLVYHMAQDLTGSELLDSTQNHFNATPQGGFVSSSLLQTTLGKAIQFNGIDTELRVLLPKSQKNVYIGVSTEGSPLVDEAVIGSYGYSSKHFAYSMSSETESHLQEYGTGIVGTLSDFDFTSTQASNIILDDNPNASSVTNIETLINNADLSSQMTIQAVGTPCDFNSDQLNMYGTNGGAIHGSNAYFELLSPEIGHGIVSIKFTWEPVPGGNWHDDDLTDAQFYFQLMHSVPPNYHVGSWGYNSPTTNIVATYRLRSTRSNIIHHLGHSQAFTYLASHEVEILIDTINQTSELKMDDVSISVENLDTTLFANGSIYFHWHWHNYGNNAIPQVIKNIYLFEERTTSTINENDHEFELQIPAGTLPTEPTIVDITLGSYLGNIATKTDGVYTHLLGGTEVCDTPPGSHWTMNDITGTVVADEYGSHDLTNNGMVVGTGVFGDSLDSSAAINYLSSDADISFRTISMWFRRDVLTNVTCLLTTDADAQVVPIMPNPDNRLYIWNGTGPIYTTLTVDDTDWHHLVIREGTTNNEHYYCLDGVWSTALDTQLGGLFKNLGRSAFSLNQENGCFDNVQVYNYILTDEEVNFLYTARDPWKRIIVTDSNGLECQFELSQFNNVPETISFAATTERFFGSDQAGTSIYDSSVGAPTDNGTYYTFAGGDGLFTTANPIDESTHYPHLKFRAHNLELGGIQTIWKSGGYSNGMGFALDSEGNLGIYSMATDTPSNIKIPAEFIKVDTWYEVVSDKVSIALIDADTGIVLKKIYGFINPTNGSADECIGCSSSNSPITGIDHGGQTDYFVGDIEYIRLTTTRPTIPEEGSIVLHAQIEGYDETLDQKLRVNFNRANPDNSANIGFTGSTTAQSIWEDTALFHFNQDPNSESASIDSVAGENLVHTNSPTLYRRGQIGLDGTDQYLVNNDVFLDPVSFSGTIAFVIDDNWGGGGLWHQGRNTASGNQGTAFYITGTISIQWFNGVWRGASTTETVKPGFNIFSISVSGTTATTCLNGVIEEHTLPAAMASSTYPLQVGCLYGSSLSTYFRGYITHLSFSEALTKSATALQAIDKNLRGELFTAVSTKSVNNLICTIPYGVLPISENAILQFGSVNQLRVADSPYNSVPELSNGILVDGVSSNYFGWVYLSGATPTQLMKICASEGMLTDSIWIYYSDSAGQSGVYAPASIDISTCDTEDGSFTAAATHIPSAADESPGTCLWGGVIRIAKIDLPESSRWIRIDMTNTSTWILLSEIELRASVGYAADFMTPLLLEDVSGTNDFDCSKFFDTLGDSDTVLTHHWTFENVNGNIVRNQVLTGEPATMTNIDIDGGGKWSNCMFTTGTSSTRTLEPPIPIHFKSVSYWHRHNGDLSGDCCVGVNGIGGTFGANSVALMRSSFSYEIYVNNIQSGFYVSDTNWHHIVLVEGSDPNHHWLWVDGVKSATEITTNFSGLIRGFGNYGTSTAWSVGGIDNIQIYRSKLTAEQIQELYLALDEDFTVDFKPWERLRITDINNNLIPTYFHRWEDRSALMYLRIPELSSTNEITIDYASTNPLSSYINRTDPLQRLQPSYWDLVQSVDTQSEFTGVGFHSTTADHCQLRGKHLIHGDFTLVVDVDLIQFPNIDGAVLGIRWYTLEGDMIQFMILATATGPSYIFQYRLNGQTSNTYIETVPMSASSTRLKLMRVDNVYSCSYEEGSGEIPLVNTYIAAAGGAGAPTIGANGWGSLPTLEFTLSNYNQTGATTGHLTSIYRGSSLWESFMETTNSSNTNLHPSPVGNLATAIGPLHRMTYFDGNGDYWSLSPTLSETLSANASHTWICIFKRSAVGAGPRDTIFSVHTTSSSGNNRSIAWLPEGSSRLQYVMCDNSGNGMGSVNATTNVCDNQWHTCAGTFDNDTKKLSIYIDGILEATTFTTSEWIIPTNARISLGQEWDTSASDYWNGNLGAFKLDARTWSAIEIQAYHQSQINQLFEISGTHSDTDTPSITYLYNPGSQTHIEVEGTPTLSRELSIGNSTGLEPFSGSLNRVLISTKIYTVEEIDLRDKIANDRLLKYTPSS